MSLSDLGAAAVTYSGGWNWPVFRLRPDSKEPETRHGFHDATADSATIVEEWERHPTSNVGIATGAASGLVVIDLDPPPPPKTPEDKPGPSGWDTVTDLQRTLGPLPKTLMVKTPRGWHVYLRHPGVEVRCSAGRLGCGVDVRGDGGYVVAPPSRIGGSFYGWVLRDGRAEPIPSDLPDLPESWLAAMLARPTERPSSGDRDVLYVRAAVRAEIDAVRTAVEGTRNSTLNTSAFALARFSKEGKVREPDLVTLLLGAAVESGLGEDEAHRTIRSAFDARKAAA